ncbi:MAG: hypothetical protein A3F10_01170 [Coxiella sp. RIFCSPHIGHO2_12_FULL_42_15]|nr:MAG: hypothetical protein A3F10_01170 [Coxiella sp. RIFCSPHIGHO2_12_FULL_42_15]
MHKAILLEKAYENLIKSISTFDLELFINTLYLYNGDRDSLKVLLNKADDKGLPPIAHLFNYLPDPKSWGEPLKYDLKLISEPHVPGSIYLSRENAGIYKVFDHNGVILADPLKGIDLDQLESRLEDEELKESVLAVTALRRARLNPTQLDFRTQEALIGLMIGILLNCGGNEKTAIQRNSGTLFSSRSILNPNIISRCRLLYANLLSNKAPRYDIQLLLPEKAINKIEKIFVDNLCHNFNENENALSNLFEQIADRTAQPAAELIVARCNDSTYLRDITKKLNSYGQYRLDRIDKIITIPKAARKDFCLWYLYCLLHAKKINKFKFDKKPFEVVFDFFMELKNKNEGHYLEWKKILLENIEISHFSELKKNTMVKCFLEEEPVNDSSNAINEIEVIEKEKGKKKKKNKHPKGKKKQENPGDEKEIEAVIEPVNNSPEVISESLSVEIIPESIPNEIPPLCRKKGEKIIHVNKEVMDKMVESMIDKKNLPSASQQLYNIASILINQLDNDHPYFEKIQYFITGVNGKIKIPNVRYEYENDELFDRNDIRLYWNQSIKQFLLIAEKYSLSDDEIVKIAIKSILLRLSDLKIIDEIKSTINEFLVSLGIEKNKFHLIGSLATECIEDAFVSDQPPIIKKDVDLAIVIRPIDENDLSKLFSSLGSFFSKKGYSLIHKKTPSEKDDKYVMSFSISYKEYPFDLTFYCDPHLKLRAMRVDTYKGFIIELDKEQLISSHHQLMFLLHKERSFDFSRFGDVSVLAFVLRELAVINKFNIHLSKESSQEIETFLNNPNNKDTISWAVGLCITKYIYDFQSERLKYLEEKNLLQQAVPFTSILSNGSTKEFIYTVVSEVLNNIPTVGHYNFFPIVYLSMFYIHTFTSIQCDDQNVFQHIEKLTFPKTIRQAVEDCMRAWFELLVHSEQPYHVNSIATCIYSVMKSKFPERLTEPSLPVENNSSEPVVGEERDELRIAQ